MWVLIVAVVTASLLGSFHCVGMCGPLAIWASGAGDHVKKGTWAAATSLYHVGRLSTYALAGLIAGAIGSAVDFGGHALGYQVAAARVVGVTMIAIGLFKLWKMVRSKSTGAELKPTVVGGVLVKLRPYIFRLPITARAFVIGLLTTLLPCGWLYLFALIAGGTGSPMMGAIVMAAFWIGTVPALVTLVAGIRLMSVKFTRLVPAIAAVLLICAGCVTASGRGFAGLNSLEDLVSAGDTMEQIENADDVLLPCCRAAGEANDGR